MYRDMKENYCILFTTVFYTLFTFKTEFFDVFSFKVRLISMVILHVRSGVPMLAPPSSDTYPHSLKRGK